VLDYILLLYLINGSEHNGNSLPENCKKLVIYAVFITLLKFIRMCAFQNLLRPERIRRCVERLSNLISTNKLAWNLAVS